MTKEQFDEQATICTVCDSSPLLRKEIKEIMFSGEPPKVNYICYCPECFWAGQKSGYCKSPEGAIKSWNRKNAKGGW